MAGTFRSLEEKDFRLFFIGQAVSLCGTWMQNLALGWLVYKMTKSSFDLGLVEFANLCPVLILSIWAGSLADRMDKRSIVIAANALMILQSAALAYLTFTNQIQFWQVLCLAAIMGILSAFETPARQAMIAQLVRRENLVNAISLNSSLFNGARSVGPALAAGFITVFGEASCFLANALSYGGALVAVYMLELKPLESNERKSDTGILGGFRFVFSNRDIFAALRLAATLGLLGIPFSVLMPAIVSEVYHKGVGEFGAIRALSGLGSLLAALALAAQASSKNLPKRIAYANLGFAACLGIFAFNSDFILALPLAFVLGYFMTTQMAGTNSFIQLRVPDELRGRLMSIWTLIMLGLSPLGSLGLGYISAEFNAPVALGLASVLLLVSWSIYAWFKR